MLLWWDEVIGGEKKMIVRGSGLREIGLWRRERMEMRKRGLMCSFCECVKRVMKGKE